MLEAATLAATHTPGRAGERCDYKWVQWTPPEWERRPPVQPRQPEPPLPDPDRAYLRYLVPPDAHPRRRRGSGGDDDDDVTYG